MYFNDLPFTKTNHQYITMGIFKTSLWLARVHIIIDNKGLYDHSNLKFK